MTCSVRCAAVSTIRRALQLDRKLYACIASRESKTDERRCSILSSGHRRASARLEQELHLVQANTELVVDQELGQHMRLSTAQPVGQPRLLCPNPSPEPQSPVDQRPTLGIRCGSRVPIETLGAFIAEAPALRLDWDPILRVNDCSCPGPSGRPYAAARVTLAIPRRALPVTSQERSTPKPLIDHGGRRRDNRRSAVGIPTLSRLAHR